MSGTPPTFDTNYPIRDNSVGTIFELTPSELVHVPCAAQSASPSGELSWNTSTKVLTVDGHDLHRRQRQDLERLA